MGIKLKRFHTDIYYPPWYEESIKIFTDKLIGKQLICSYHATKKYRTFSKEYQRLIRDLLATIQLENCIDYVFEFYANNKNEIKKACFRLPTNNEFDSDVIFVVSSAGKLVTIFLNKNFDPHINLNKDLYEQGELNA